MKKAISKKVALFIGVIMIAVGGFSTLSFAMNFNTITDPFMILHLGAFGLNVKHIEVNKAKVSSGSLGLAIKTPTLCFPTLGCLPQKGTGWTKVHFARSTVTKGGSTVTKTLVNVPNLKITQKTKWPSHSGKVRITLVFQLGNAVNTKTYFRTPQ